MSEKNKKYRLITRSDFDGLVCALLFIQLEMLNDVTFVHPKDMQDGKIEVSDRDISTNLPYVEGIHLAFDHHSSEQQRVGKKENHIIDPKAPSAARVVYNYYGGADTFTEVSPDMMDAVDKADSANFTKKEVLSPKNWVLLNFIMDPRTGLGRYKEFRIPNYQLMLDLIVKLRKVGKYNINDILEFPDVKERVELYKEQEQKAKEQIGRIAEVQKNLVILDLREEEQIFVTNRFMVYALYPQTNVSMHIMWGKDKQNTVFAMGKSIFKTDCKTDIGGLALKYGGGGHKKAGTCQIENDKAEEVKKELIDVLVEN